MEKRILIVEDLPELRQILCHHLKQKFPFFSVDEADSGLAASTCLAKHEYSLVISDSEMWNGNGYWLYKFMRDNFPKVPLVLWTSDPGQFHWEIGTTLKSIVRKDDLSGLYTEIEKVRL